MRLIIFFTIYLIIMAKSTISNIKYYAQHAQKLNQEGAAINSSELAN